MVICRAALRCRRALTHSMILPPSAPAFPRPLAGTASRVIYAASTEGNRTLALTSITIAHQLGKAEAVRRITEEPYNTTVKLEGKVEISQTKWHDDYADISDYAYVYAKAQGITVTSLITVSENTVVINGDIPSLFIPLKDAILKFAVKRSERLLANEDAAPVVGTSTSDF
jgi:hypothetical protein